MSTWLAPASLHGWLIVVKLGLLAATLALAAHARLRLVPTLDAAGLPGLARHIVAVTLLGVAMLITGVAIRTGGVW
jgi:putative copper export protein